MKVCKGGMARSLTDKPEDFMRLFRFVLAAIFAFLVLTTLAMWLYPGGRFGDKTSPGYSFSLNFFSDLGRTVAHNGAPNWVSSALFTLALSLAGTALGVFFWNFARFFGRASSISKGGAWLGTFWGVLAAICFVGIALTPANLLPLYHHHFVGYAFRFFALAVSIYALVILCDGGFPRAASLIFVAFALGLFFYIGMLNGVLSTKTHDGLVAQAISQKLIVYASLLCIGAQAGLALRQIKLSKR